MRLLTGSKEFFCEILLCTAAFPVIAAILLCFYPQNALFFDYIRSLRNGNCYGDLLPPA